MNYAPRASLASTKVLGPREQRIRPPAETSLTALSENSSECYQHVLNDNNSLSSKQVPFLDRVVDPLGKRSMLSDKLDIDSVILETSFCTHAIVLFTLVTGESVFLGNNNELASGELKLGAAECLNSVVYVLK